jgi:excisionase family DNA binding protein
MDILIHVCGWCNLVYRIPGMATSIPSKDAALPGLLSVRQLADYLAVPVSTVYQWRTQGRGPSGFRVGKQVRYRTSDVVEWLDNAANKENA